jgi:hypothetical protein
LATRCHLHVGRSALSGSRISERRRVDQEPSSGHACQRRRSCRPAAHGSVLDAHIPAR